MSWTAPKEPKFLKIRIFHENDVQIISSCLKDGVDDIHVNVSEGGIARLWIRNADRKRHSGKYTCVANNSAGFDSKDIEVVVESKWQFEIYEIVVWLVEMIKMMTSGDVGGCSSDTFAGRILLTIQL